MTIAGTTPSQAIQSLNLDAHIILHEIDATALGGTILRFHNGTNELKQPVVWAGQTYPFLPIHTSGFEWTGKGPLPQPKLAIANVDGFFTILTLSLQDMIGAKVTRRRTLARFLDAVNFASGVNPTANPAYEFPKDVYYIDRKASDAGALIQFDLKASFDMQGVKIPLRLILADVCEWEYKGPDCGYIPGPMFDSQDNVITNSDLDVCGHRYHSCTKRFGTAATVVLPFGGFPAAGLIPDG